MQVKEIPGHRQYIVSEYGHVWRVAGAKQAARRPLKVTPQYHKGIATDYLYVSILSEDGQDDQGKTIDLPIFTKIPVCRLVAMAFIGPPPIHRPWIRHKDGNKRNNHYSNLEWVTVSEVQRAHIAVGENHWNYGKTWGASTKKAMSKAKMGEKHPRFHGYYTFKGKKYPSAREAARCTGFNSKSIIRWSKIGAKGWKFEPITKS